MRALLVVTAVFEGATGIALLARPSLPITALLGSGPDAPSGALIARVAGAALLSLAAACWLARAERSRATQGLVVALLTYNVAAAVLLTLAPVTAGPIGPALWPAVAAHAALATWCAVVLARHVGRAAVGEHAP